MSRACARTIGPRIRICRCDDASGRCSVLNRLDQRNGSCLFKPPSSIRLVFHAIVFAQHAPRPQRGSVADLAGDDCGLNSSRALPTFVCPKPSSRDDVDVARAVSGSMKSRANMVVVETAPEGATSVGKSIIDLSPVRTVGLDLAKHVFQIHGVDASGRVVVAKAIRRNKLLEFFASLPPCLVGLEASGSAHHWARELIKLGHGARMMPPAYVKPYVRRQKNDASAICEAVTRPSMRFVGVRSLENQAALMRHKAREMLVSQRTQLLNGLRGHLTEVGVIAPQGPRYARELAELIEACDETIPFEVCEALAPLVVQLRNLDEAIARLDRTIVKMAQKDETARRLMSIPGFGPITASAMAATIQDTSSFAGPREFAAFLGLTPEQNSSGGKPKLGRISKMGNRYLRKLLVVGAHVVLFHRKPHTDPLRMWAKKLIEKKPFKLVAVALANKMARIAFAIMRGTTVYREIPA
jgi:transposase